MIPIPIRIGSNYTVETIGWSEHFCPKCQEAQPFRIQRLMVRMSIYFLPVFSIKKM